MKNNIATISINTECNNNCLYCFNRKNASQKKELSLDEIKEISRWLKKTYSGVGILGGEPLLHSNIHEIIKYLSTEFLQVKLITNLVSDDENLIKYLKGIDNLTYLINTTTDKKNKELFNKNINTLFIENNFEVHNNNYPVFSLVFTGNKEIDTQSIDNVINILKKFPQKFWRLRVMPNMPCIDNNIEYKMMNYDYQFNYFIDKVSSELGRIILSFDCGINFCFISPNVLQKLKKAFCFIYSYSFCSGPHTDISVDKTISYCHYLSHLYYQPKFYYEFETPNDYVNYHSLVKEKYFTKHKYLCKEIMNKDACSKNCQGFCPALTSKILQEKISIN